MVATEDTKKTANNAVSSNGTNDAVSKTLEAIQKNHHDIISVEKNDVVSFVVQACGLINNWAHQ